MKKLLYILLVALVAVSCTKEDRKNRIVEQEASIDRYISSLKDVRVERNNGSNRVVTKEGKGKDSLAIGDSLRFYYAGYVFSNGKGELFATNDTTVAIAHSFELEQGVESRILSHKELVPGLANGLVGARAGEECQVIFSAKYGYGNTIVYNVPKLSPLIFEIRIESIVKN